MTRAAKPKRTTKKSKASKPKRSVRSSISKPRTAITVRGDTQTVSRIGSKANIVQGKNITATITNQEGLQSGELAALFGKIYERIESLPATRAADKEEIAQTVQRIESEVAEKGEQADESRLQRWIDNLNQMAPDIVDVIVASLGGPLSAATAVLKKVAERARQRPPA